MEKTFNDIANEKYDGLVLLGCNGVQAWIDGMFADGFPKGVTRDNFTEPYYVKTSGGRTDLVFPFSKHGFDDSLIAWRLVFGDCSWISDYIVNYKNALKQSAGKAKPFGAFLRKMGGIFSKTYKGYFPINQKVNIKPWLSEQ